MADSLARRPAEEPLGDALIEVITGLYRQPQAEGLPQHWLRDFRALVGREPELHGEYLKASAEAEQALADAIARRMHAPPGQLRARVLAAMVVGAERAAVRHWVASRKGSLLQTVRAAVTQSVAGIDGPS